jgi:hypothetical protein
MNTRIALLVLVALSPGVVQAQTVKFAIGGGPTVPVGDFNKVDKLGWNAMGMAVYEPPNTRLGIRLDAMYGEHHTKSGLPSAKTKLMGATGGLELRLSGDSKVKPYLVASAGVYEVKIEVTGAGTASETKFTAGGGAGLSIKIGSVGAFLEGRYLSAFTSGSHTNFIPFSVGVIFGG